VRIGIGASKRTIAGRKKDAGRSGIGIGITRIARSSFIVGRRISNFPLSEIVLSATVMTGTTGLIGAIVIMIGNNEPIRGKASVHDRLGGRLSVHDRLGNRVEYFPRSQ